MNALIDKQRDKKEASIAVALFWGGFVVTLCFIAVGNAPMEIGGAWYGLFTMFLYMALYSLIRTRSHVAGGYLPFRFSILYTRFAPIGAILFTPVLLNMGLNLSEIKAFMVGYAWYVFGPMTCFWFLFFSREKSFP